MIESTAVLEGEDIPTLYLAVTCLKLLWEQHPDIIDKLGEEFNQPHIREHAARADKILAKLQRL